MLEQASELWWALGLFAGWILTAALVNRLRPTHRPRLRRIAILAVLYAVTLLASYACREAGQPAAQAGLRIAAELVRVFTIVNIGAMLVFTVFWPVTGVTLPMIATDLVVGLGYIVATLLILNSHSIDPTGALVSGAVVSAVLAISLQSTLGNILGGIALQLDGSIHEGDWIQLENGKQGRVAAVRWRHTIVETRDWTTIIVPNSQLLGNNITILGKRGGETAPLRMWVWFNVDFRYSPAHVIDIVLQAVSSSPIENVAPDPKPSCVCMDFTKEGRESVATYAVRYWLIDLATDDPTNSRVRTRIYSALKRAGIPLAVPAHTAFVEIQDDVRKAKRLAREGDAYLDAVKTVHLFQSMTEEELRLLASNMNHAIYSAGETITRQGATAHWLYILTAGEAEIRMLVDPDGAGGIPEQRVAVAKIAAPDFFGEMSLMTGEPRTADVVATTEVECFRLGRKPFEALLAARPAIANEMSEKMATRRIQLMAVREGVDATVLASRHDGERERILSGIKTFFGL